MNKRYLSKTPNVTSKCNKNCPAFLVIKKKGFSEPVYTGMAFRLSLTFLKKKKWFSCFILCLQSWLSCFLWCQPHQIFRENYRHQKGALGFFGRTQILFFAHLNKNADLSYWRKKSLLFLQKQFRWPIKIGKFHLCSKRQLRGKKRTIWGLRGFFCMFVQKDDKEIRREQYMRA